MGVCSSKEKVSEASKKVESGKPPEEPGVVDESGIKPVVRYTKWMPGEEDPKGIRSSGREAISAEVAGEIVLAEPEVESQPKDAATVEMLRDSIKTHILFKHLKEPQLLRCIGAMTRQTFRKGEVVFAQGDAGDNFYIVESGGFDVLVTKTTVKGEETAPVCVAHFARGGSFGEMSLLYRRPRTATLTATCNSRVWKLCRTSYRSILLNAASLSEMEMHKFLQTVPVFEWLNGNTKSKVADTLQSVEFGAGETIVAQGMKRANCFYLIKAGEVSIRQQQEDTEREDGGRRPSRFSRASAMSSEAYEVARLGVGAWFGAGSVEDEQLVCMVQEFLAANFGQSFDEGQAEGAVEPSEEAFSDRRGSSATAGSNGGRARRFWVLGGDCTSADVVATSSAVLLEMPFSSMAEFLRPLQDSSLEVFHVTMTQLLKGIMTFESLSSSQLDQLVRAMKRRTYEDQELIVKQGEPGSSLFVIVRGEVSVEKWDAAGVTSVRVLTLGVQEVFGERSVLTSRPRGADCVAVGQVLCLELSGQDFREICPKKILDQLRQKRYLSDLSNITFKLDELIAKQTVGVGGFGRVRMVIHRSTGNPYALKCMEKRKIIRLGQKEHILSERALLAEIDHPFITKLYATFKRHHFLYMLLELNIGGEMFTLLRNVDVLNEATAKFYSACMVLALEYLHKNHIVYRDLKPENTMFDENGYIKLVDFGFAKKLSSRTYTVCGTPEYIAPEVLLNCGHGLAVDWWALGIYIYEMLAGYTPFSERNTVRSNFQLSENIVKNKVRFPSSFSSDVRSLVSKLLNSNPVNRVRWATGQIVDIRRHRWFRGIDWEALAERKPVPPHRPKVLTPTDLSNFDKFKECEDGSMTDIKWAGSASDWDANW